MSNAFLVGKNGRGNHPVINLKHLNQFIPHQNFKMEDLFCLRNVAEGRFHVQTGDEGCIFFSYISSILKKICQIFMVREPLRVALPMFWFRPNPSNIYKTLKSPYISAKANKYSIDNIP